MDRHPHRGCQGSTPWPAGRRRVFEAQPADPSPPARRSFRCGQARIRPPSARALPT